MSYGGVQFGSFGLQRYTIDTTGPINGRRSRCSTASTRPTRTRTASAISALPSGRSPRRPSTWVLDDDTALTWEGEYVNDRRRFDTGVAAINGDARALPISRFLGEPSNDFQQLPRLPPDPDAHPPDQRRLGVERRRLFAVLRRAVVGHDSRRLRRRHDPALGQNVFFRTRQNIAPWQEQYQSAIANISGKFQGDVVTHNVVLGTEQGWLVSDRFRAAQSIPSMSDPTTWLAIDGVNPIYDNPNFGLPNPATPFSFDSTFRRESARRLRAGHDRRGRALEGAGRRALRSRRYDVHPRDRHATAVRPVSTRTDQSFDHGSPRVGVVYQPIPEKLSYYAMYSDSFDPPGGGPRLDTRPACSPSWAKSGKAASRPSRSTG